MAPRRAILLLLVAATAACSGLLASSSSSPAVVHAARDMPRRDDDVPQAAAETSVVVQPPTVDGHGGTPLALSGVQPHPIHPAVQRTVYDVTVVFRATALLGPPRLQYYVVPADDASVPISGAGADDGAKAGAATMVVGLIMFFLGLLLGAMSVLISNFLGGGGGDDGAIPKDPEVVLAQQAAGAANKARRGY